MKTHGWTDDQAPDFALTDDGNLIFHSHPDMYNYVVGDVIEYKTRLGATHFEIIFVEKANLKDYDPDLQRITAKKLD